MHKVLILQSGSEYILWICRLSTFGFTNFISVISNLTFSSMIFTVIYIVLQRSLISFFKSISLAMISEPCLLLTETFYHAILLHPFNLCSLRLPTDLLFQPCFDNYVEHLLTIIMLIIWSDLHSFYIYCFTTTALSKNLHLPLQDSLYLALQISFLLYLTWTYIFLD